MAIATNGLQIVRIAGAVFNQQLSAADYSEILTANKTAAELNAWANSAVAAEFKGKTTLDISKAVLANLGLTQPGLDAWLAGQLTAGGGVAKAGETMLSLLNDYSNMTADATFGASATTFNTKAAGSQALSQTAGTATGTYAAVSTANAALTLTSATQTSTGTAGDDTFTAAAGTWGVGDIVNGSTGTDTLNATVSGTAPTQSATSLVGIEVLNLTASPNATTLDLTGVTGLKEVNNASSANGASLSVANLGNVVNTTITGGNNATTISYAAAAVASTTADAATVSLKGTAVGSSFTTSGVETLTINSGTSANTLASLSAVGMSKLVVTGDQALTIGGTTGNNGSTTVVGTATYDLSAATGALTFTTGSGTGGTAAVGVTVTGPTAATAGALNLTTGSLNDTITLGAGANTVDAKAGNDTITSGGGANTITPGTGNDTINAGAGVDTIRFAEAGATTADTVNTFGTTDVIAINIGLAAVTGTATVAASSASANATFGVVPTSATSPVLQNVAGTATANAVTFQAIAPNATATVGTVAGTSNVIALNGAYTDGTALGVVAALGTSATTGITTVATGRFLLVTYSVGNIAQVWSYGGDGNGPTGGNQSLNTDINSDELSLVATLNGVALNGLTAANFSTYLTPVVASSSVVNAGQTITLNGLLNTVSTVSNASGQFFSAGDDSVTANAGSLPTAAAAGSTTQGVTLIDGSTTDTDSFTATVLAGGWDLNTTLVNIETLNLTYAVTDNGFDATSMAVGTSTFNISGTGNTGTITTANGRAFGLGAEYRGTATVVDNTPTLNLAGNTGTLTSTSPTFTTDSATTSLTINVNGASGLNLGAAELVNTNAITVKGASNLTIYGTAAQFGDSKITATSPNYTGSLTLVPTATTGDLDFSDVTSPSTGIRRVNIPSAYNSTITLNENNTGAFTVGVAATSTLAWAVAQAGSGQSDAVTVSFGSAATGSGAITATSIESLTLAGGTSATGTLTLGAVALTNGAGTQTVTITNPGNVAFTSADAQATITADTVTTTGVVGTLGTSAIPLVLANTAGVSFTGGAGNTAVSGSSAADVITTGIGNDTILGLGGDDRILAGDGTNSINGGTGSDVMTGGSGVDTYIFSATTTNGADTITNFTGATDKLNVVAMTVAAITAGTLLSSAGSAVTTADRKDYLQVFNTDGTAASIVTGSALTLSLADFTAGTLTNVAAFIAAKFTGSSSATGTDTGIYVFNHTATGSTTSYVYQWDNDASANVTQAAELTLVGTISRGTTTLVNADFIIA